MVVRGSGGRGLKVKPTRPSQLFCALLRHHANSRVLSVVASVRLCVTPAAQTGAAITSLLGKRRAPRPLRCKPGRLDRCIRIQPRQHVHLIDSRITGGSVLDGRVKTGAPWLSLNESNATAVSI